MITEEVYQSMQTVLLARIQGIEDAAAPTAFLDLDAGTAAAALTEQHGSTAVIHVEGIMGKHMSSLEMLCGGASMDAIAQAITQASKDPDTHTILLNYNSPGGTVQGTPELAAHIAHTAANSGKTVIAYTDSVMASAAYYTASQAHQVFAARSSTVGSIGVLIKHQDISSQLAQAGVKITEITGGTRKAQFSPFKPLSPDDIAELQAEVDAHHADFKAAVRTGRGQAIDDKYLQGQTFNGNDAHTAGLIDGIYPTLDDLLKAIV